MAAALIYPLFEGLGLAVEGIAAELGFTEVLAARAGGAAQGGISGAIGSKIDEALLNAVGPETLEKINNAKAQTNKAVMYWNYGPDTGFGPVQGTGGRGGTAQKRAISQPNIFDTGKVPQQPPKTNILPVNIFGMSPNGVTSDQNVIIPNQFTGLFGSENGAIPISVLGATTDSGSGSSTGAAAGAVGIGNGAGSGDLPVGTAPTRDIDTSLGNLPIDTKTPVNQINAGSIAQYIIEYSNTVATSDTVDHVAATDEVIKRNPNFILVSKELNTFYTKKLPKTDEYKAIAGVYNGRDLSLNNCRMAIEEGLKVFYLTDEVGTVVNLKQNTGFKIPTIWGNFVGPYSKNDNLPVSLLDLYSAYHDYDYTAYGFFDMVGDYKLLSRISQNYGRMIPAEKPAAKTALLYFSTVGVSAGSLIGSLPKNISRVPSTQMPADDIYTQLYPTQSTDRPIEQYALERTSWYGDLERELETATITSSMFAIAGKGGNKLLAQEFGNILVEVL